MTTVVRNIAIDCTDPYGLASFWSEVLSQPIYHEHRPGDEEVGIDLPNGQTLFFQRVPEPRTGKNRIHMCAARRAPRF